MILLTTGCLALLARGGDRSAHFAAILAILALFTLAHGMAGAVVGVAILLYQRRYKLASAWSLSALLLAAVFVWRLSAAKLPMAAALNVAGLKKLATYWVTLLGGAPSVNDVGAAFLLGCALLAGFAWLCWRRAYRADLFLFAVAANALLATLMISYGRSSAAEIPPLSSRYMIQSAMAWIAISVLLWKQAPSLRWSNVGAAALVVLAAGASIAQSAHHVPIAREFVQRRVNAMLQYDFRRTFEGQKRPIFPSPKRADATIAKAAADGVFYLLPPESPTVELDVPVREEHFTFAFDWFTLGATNVHLRGWMLPSGPLELEDYEPYLMLQQKGSSFVFKGIAEPRHDVAAVLRRPDALHSGFRFVVPREKLPPGAFNVILMLHDGDRAWFSRTNRQVNLTPLPAAAGLAVAPE